MAYKLKQQFQNRWFNGGGKNIAMNDKLSQEDLQFIFDNQKEEIVIEVKTKPRTTKKSKK